MVMSLEIKLNLQLNDTTKKEGIDFDDTFSLLARIKVIRIFCAFIYYKNFILYQIDVKNIFLNSYTYE